GRGADLVGVRIDDQREAGAVLARELVNAGEVSPRQRAAVVHVRKIAVACEREPVIAQIADQLLRLDLRLRQREAAEQPDARLRLSELLIDGQARDPVLE